MLKIEREIVSRTMSENNTSLPQCQASFNSDGRIVLRNHDCYDVLNKQDEIIILTKSETRAIFELIFQYKKIKDIYDLPF